MSDAIESSPNSNYLSQTDGSTKPSQEHATPSTTPSPKNNLKVTNWELVELWEYREETFKPLPIDGDKRWFVIDELSERYVSEPVTIGGWKVYKCYPDKRPPLMMPYFAINAQGMMYVFFPYMRDLMQFMTKYGTWGAW